MIDSILRYNTNQAAVFIGCSSSTLKISRVTGTLLGRKAPVYRKLGRKVVYDREVLQSWLEQFGTRTNTAA